ncbi:MAG: phosphoribosylanthranilate isomerase [Breznakibacter sp.]|nr:phosphoribosylanthranilate isomerase [Breznakibacter sp.]
MRDPQNIQDLGTVQPDFVGFIFYPKSPRYVGEEWDESIVKSIPSSIKKIGVFVNESVEKINLLASKYQLDGIQLHGSETPEICQTIKDKNLLVLKAFSVDESFDFELIKKYESFCDYFLFDTKTSQHGGSGVKFDWKKLYEYTSSIPFFLSGGIMEEDVNEIKSLNIKGLYSVDINSKFEIEPALKDIKMVERFAQKLRQ